jgi:hypothetical protein
MRPLRPAGSIAPAGAYGLIVKPKACIPCRTRKVKCERADPCENCIKWSIECVYPSPKRTSRRPKKSQPTSQPLLSLSSSSSSPVTGLDTTLKSRLEVVEDLLRQLVPRHESIPLENRDHAEQEVEASSRLPEDLLDSMTKLLTLIENGRAAQSPPPQPPSPIRLMPFPFDTFSLDAGALHPPARLMTMCWATYLDNIDPLIKILHRATTEAMLWTAASNPHELQVGQAALLFATYFASLSSTPPEVTELRFGMPKATALRVYRGAVEHALMRAGIFTSEDLATLQAVVLFISVDRFGDDARRAWALSGLASRLGSLETSSANQLSPFEREIRSRLRWQLWQLDFRAHEDLGRGSHPPSPQELPALPTNARDIDMDPGMVVPPVAFQGWTEASFSLIQVDLALASRALAGTLRLPDKARLINECEQKLQATYVRHCDGTQPIHWLGRHVSHVRLMELRFMLRFEQRVLPGNCGLWPNPIDDHLFVSAVDILDTDGRLAREPSAAQWSWLLNGYLQFWPMRFLLDELGRRSATSELVDHAWNVVNRSFERWKSSGSAMDGNVTANAQTLNKLLEQTQAKKAASAATAERPWHISFYNPSELQASRPRLRAAVRRNTKDTAALAIEESAGSDGQQSQDLNAALNNTV